MYDSRPNTASSVSSSVAGSAYGGYEYAQAPLQSQQASLSMGAPSSAPQSAGVNGLINVRRDSAPQHIPLPTHQSHAGFRQGLDGPTPTQQNPFPVSAGGMPASIHATRQPSTTAAPGGFPFQALTQPMTGHGIAQGYQQQFAFQR